MNTNRPEISKETILKASEIIAGRVEGIASEIASCYHLYIDGYELAKKLESTYFWDVDFQVIEELENMHNEVESIHKKVCMQWVIDDQITPPLEIGTKIKQGVINGVYGHDAAMYKVTKYGETMKGRHQVIRFEDAVAI